MRINAIIVVRKPPAWKASRGMNDMPTMTQKMASDAEAAGAQHGLVGDASHLFHGASSSADQAIAGRQPLSVATIDRAADAG